MEGGKEGGEKEKLSTFKVGSTFFFRFGEKLGPEKRKEQALSPPHYVISGEKEREPMDEDFCHRPLKTFGGEDRYPRKKKKKKKV